MTANRDLTQNEPNSTGDSRADRNRQDVWGIPPEWRIWFLIIFTIKMAVWTALVIRHELAYGGHATGMHAAIAVMDSAADAAPVFAATTILMLEIGAGLMITYNYLYNKIVQRVIDGHIEEGRAQGIAEGEERGIAIGEERGEARGRAAGIAEGEARGEARGIAETEARMRAEFAEWLARKEEAERRGVPFDEPMPGSDSGANGHAPQP